MPVITIAGNDGISKNNKEKMVKEVTKIVADAYDLPESAITILIQGYSTEDIGVSGKLLSEK
ncbi:tautomerase family protein [Methanobrevibacter sp. OttesenSCG-928-K11]|nr:tautomerase family protein [Methanobrevibacter sp. OttesenSCG-928-K11]MDL2270232.1 tautomerase family protein [Methanobrevibacter sp. OttesenSCG-928-I08]